MLKILLLYVNMCCNRISSGSVATAPRESRRQNKIPRRLSRYQGGLWTLSRGVFPGWHQPFRDHLPRVYMACEKLHWPYGKHCNRYIYLQSPFHLKGGLQLSNVAVPQRHDGIPWSTVSLCSSGGSWRGFRAEMAVPLEADNHDANGPESTHPKAHVQPAQCHHWPHHEGRGCSAFHW